MLGEFIQAGKARDRSLKKKYMLKQVKEKPESIVKGNLMKIESIKLV